MEQGLHKSDEGVWFYHEHLGKGLPESKENKTASKLLGGKKITTTDGTFKRSYDIDQGNLDLSGDHTENSEIRGSNIVLEKVS